ACTDDVPGVCQGSGTYVCKGDQSGTECNIISSGSPGPEICDSLDNDCDGLTDEPAHNPGSNPDYVEDDTVDILMASGETVTVYKYEASRPTASSGDQGSGSTVRACSQSNVMPWSKVTFERARFACQAAGMKLCSAGIWEEACDGEGATWDYPYSSSTYDPVTCNGEDAGYGAVVATGSLGSCLSNGYNINDLSGNLREWTTDIISYNNGGKAIYRLKGGSYRDGSHALSCSYDTIGLVEDAFSANTGFRCCSTCGNGNLEADELCDDGNLVNGDGCNAVCAPDTCGDGVVQGIEECDCGLDPVVLPAGCTDINGGAVANCSFNCMVPDERCSSLYPEDQNRGGEISDCDDPDCIGTWCEDVSDNDGDGFVEPDDCDDDNAAIHPAADEICDDGIDNNCNGFIDNAEPDKDEDGHLRCVSNAVNDCNDWDEEINPSVPEICGDGVDNNCDGQVDLNCASACEIAEYERSYIGCEYYASTTMNSALNSNFNSNFGIVVNNVNSEAVNVTITKGGAVLESATIPANDLQVFYLDYDLTLKNTVANYVIVSGGAFKIESDLPVTVYQFNPFDFSLGGSNSYTNDASLVLPKHVLTRNYMVHNRQSWLSYPGFLAVVGTADNTTIEIAYNGHVQNGPNRGSVETYTINEGDVLQVPSRTCGGDCSSDYDFTGTTIQVTNPSGHEIAVFAGNNCIDIPYGYHACDHIEEQMFPLETWGKNFVAVPIEIKTNNVFRILSAEDNNVITFAPSSVHSAVTLDAGEHIEFLSSTRFTVSSTKPASVMQYLPGQQLPPNTTTGDPAMALIVPMEQYRTSYSFVVPSSMTINYVTIIKPVSQTDSPIVYVDGVPIAESNFSTAVPGSYHGVYHLDLSSAPYDHSIVSDQPFGIMVYGFASFTSYFYPGGLDLNIINSSE
nr:MopE-related protein [Deltaproteobacteria bacterium]